MGLFGSSKNDLKCKKCGTVLPNSDRLKKLTINEGKILVKLIYRETNFTSYNIVKSYRGRFNAFFWQTMARIWNNNLKVKYDPVNIREDMLIEHILIQAKLEETLE